MIFPPFNFSDPFTVCWSSNQTIGMECIDDWCCQEVYNDAHCNITVASLTAGNYSFNISIANDISIIYRQHNVTVSGKVTNDTQCNITFFLKGGLLKTEMEYSQASHRLKFFKQTKKDRKSIKREKPHFSTDGSWVGKPSSLSFAFSCQHFQSKFQ